MSMIGSLETFSLPELLRLIDSGAKTGQLIIQSPLNDQSGDFNNYHSRTFHLWFHKGRLITIVDNSLHDQSLASLIESRGWISGRVIEKLSNICPPGVPFGSYLCNMKVLEAEKLKLLFQIQLHQVYQLFNLNSGQFQLKVIPPQKQLNSVPMPWLDMTGISMQASQVNLLALRIMRNWSGFSHKLPEKNSALQQLTHHPKCRLTAVEQEVWQMALANISLKQLAQTKHISLLEIRKAAFRLIMARLVEEIPLANFKFPDVTASPEIATIDLPSHSISKLAIAVQDDIKINSPQTSLASRRVIPKRETTQVSQALLKTLVNFLRSKL